MIAGERKRKKKVAAKGHPMVVPSHDYDPHRYEKEEDVRSLARAHAIKKDPVRHKAALHHAKTMKAEHEQRRAESDAIVKMADKGE